MLGGSFVTAAWCVLKLQIERRYPAMEGSCECSEKSAVDKRQGMVLQPTGEYTFFYGKGNENHELGTGVFVHKKIMSAVKRA
jgi:hypothetical protein